MEGALKYGLIFVSLFLILLGFVFLMAGGYLENYLTGGIMLLVAFGLLGYIYLNARNEAKRPVTQEFHVTMGGSGEMKQKQISCRSCGGPIKSENVSVVKGGLMVKCPYCGSTYALEEEPKW